MSSPAVRDAINQAVAALAAPWPTFDMSNYNSLEEVMSTIEAEAVLVQYVVADDQVQTIGGEGNQGYEETGTVVIHLMVPTGFASGPTVDKGYTIQTGLRGRRLTADVTIQSVSPFTDFGSGSVGVRGIAHDFAASLFYVNRTCG